MNKITKSFIPLADRILVKRIIPQAKTAGGILLPTTVVDKGNRGKVLSVGPGRINDKGEREPMNCKVGDVILLPSYGGTALDVANQEVKDEFVIYYDQDILGKFEE